MATIANLSIGLGVDSAKLTKGLTSAQKRTKTWARSMKKMTGGVTSALAGLAAVLGTKALLLNADALSKNAKAIGINIDAYQRLQFGVGQAGISQRSFEKGLRKMNGVVLDAGRGLSTAKDSLDAVGLSYDKMMAISPEERFGAIISGLEGIADAGVRAALAEDLLGREFATNTVAYQQMVKDGKNILTVQQGAADAAEDFNDAIARLTTSIKSNITNALAPMVEVMTSISDILNNLVVRHPTAAKWFVGLATAIAALGVAAGVAAIALWSMNAALAVLLSPFAAIAALIAGIVATFVAMGVIIYQLLQQFKLIVEATGSVGNAFSLMASAAGHEFLRIMWQGEKLKVQMLLIFNEISNAWDIAIGSLAAKFGRQMDKIAASNVGVFMGMQGGNEEAAMQTQAAANAANTDAMLALSNRLNEADEFLGSSNPFLTELKDILKPFSVSPSAGAGGPAGGARPVVPAIAEAVVVASIGGSGGGPEGGESGTSIGESLLDSIQSSFSTAMQDGDWRGFLESTMDSFTSTVIDNFAEGLFRPLDDFLGGAIDALMASLNGSDSGGGIWGALGTIFGMADGGIVPTTASSKSYADSVPAMLQPGELVVPVDQVGNFMNGGSGGGGQTFNINVTGDVSRLTRTEIVKMMPEIAAGTNMLNKESGR